MLIVEKLKKFFHVVRSLFFSGLFTIIPLAATIFFINFAYNLIVRIVDPLYRVEPEFLQAIPGADFVIVMLLIISIGAVLKVFIFHSIVHKVEKLIAKILLVRIVYSSAKTLVDFFKMPDPKNLTKKVVLIPYPKKGQYHLAFLLEDAHDTYEKIMPEHFKRYPNEKYCKVFMPNSPNPTSGYFFIMSEDEIIHTDITFEEALKTLVSCGLITPESLKQKFVDRK